MGRLSFSLTVIIRIFFSPFKFRDRSNSPKGVAAILLSFIPEYNGSIDKFLTFRAHLSSKHARYYRADRVVSIKREFRLFTTAVRPIRDYLTTTGVFVGKFPESGES